MDFLRTGIVVLRTWIIERVIPDTQVRIAWADYVRIPTSRIKRHDAETYDLAQKMPMYVRYILSMSDVGEPRILPFKMDKC